MQTAKKARQDKTRKMMDDGCYDGVLKRKLRRLRRTTNKPALFLFPKGENQDKNEIAIGSSG